MTETTNTTATPKTAEAKTPRANAVVTTTLNEETGVITFAVKGAGTMQLNPAKLHEAVMKRAAIHGLIQRVSDRAAISRNPENGQAATPQDKQARMQALVDHYMSGSELWSPTQTGTPKTKRTAIDPTIEAVAEIQGLAYADMVTRIKATCEKKGYGFDAYVAKLGTNKDVQEKMMEIVGRKSATHDIEGLNADTMLDELNAG